MGRLSASGLLLLAVLLSGCSHLDTEINKLYPPKNTVDRQVEVTKIGLQSISQFSSANAVVSAGVKDWQDRLETVITTSVPQATRVKVTFGKQEVVLEVEFSGKFPLENGESISLAGSSQIHLALAIQSAGPLGGTTSLTLSPSFKRIVLTKASYSRWRVPDGIVDMVVNVLNRYLDNVNGAIGSRAFSFTTEFLQQFDPAVFTAGGNDVASVYGKPIFLRTFVSQSALLIDEQSLRVLLHLDTATSIDIQTALASVDPAATRSASIAAVPADKTAVLVEALCSDPMFSGLKDELRSDDKRSLKALDIHCSKAARTKAAATQTARTAILGAASDDEFRKLYDEYREKFEIAQQSGLGQSMAEPGNSFAAISRRFVADSINAIGREAEIGVDIRLPDSSMTFDENLKLQPAPDLNCGSIEADCMPNFSCQDRCNQQHGSCSGRDCNRSCSWFDAPCHAWRGACELLKAGENLACNTAKGACLVGCEAEKSLKSAACFARTEARKLGCRLNQEWLNAWGNQKIGRVDGTVGMRAGSLNLLIKADGGVPAFSVGNNLDSVSMRASLAASSDVRGSIRYTPLDFGHLLCAARWSGEVRAQIVAGEQTLNPSGTITWVPFGDSLRLLASFNPITIRMQMQPEPVKALFEQNPHVAVICAPATVLGLTAQLTGELVSAVTAKPNQVDLLKDKFDWSSGALSMPMTIEPIGINFPAAQSSPISPRVLLVPSVSDRALLFMTRAAN